MKGKIIESKKSKDFELIKLKLKLESIEEARLFYHVLLHYDLKNLFSKDDQYNIDSYAKPIAGHFKNDFYEKIKKEIKKRGYEV